MNSSQCAVTLGFFGRSLRCMGIFGERTLSTSSRDVWPPSWGEKEISTKGVVDRGGEEGGGGGGGGGERKTLSRLSLSTPSLPNLTEIKHSGFANYR